MIARTALTALAILAASPAALAIDVVVEEGGTLKTLGASSPVVTFKLTNNTGKEATDVTFAIETPDDSSPKFKEIEWDGDVLDSVDDDLSGDIDISEKYDTEDQNPGHTCKSILHDDDDPVQDGDEATVVVVFDKPVPAGTQVRVHFSTKVASLHGEISVPTPVDPATGAGHTVLFASSPLVVPPVSTEPGFAITSFVAHTNPDNPIEKLVLPGAYADSEIVYDGEVAIVQLAEPLPGGVELPVLYVLAKPVTAPQPLDVLAEVVPVGPPPPACLADFNDDGQVNILDFVAFQAAFKAGDPAADVNADGVFNVLDFVAFQAEFQAGCPDAPLADSFEDYQSGPLCTQGDWEHWYLNPDSCGTVTDDAAAFGTQSLVMGPADDAVRVIDGADHATWHFQCWTRVPADATGRGWVVLLNTYSAGGDKNWSLALAIDADDALVQENPAGQADPPTVPLVVDQWIPIDVVVDLDADTCDVFYNGQTLLEGRSWSAGMNAPGKAAIEALHLDAGGPADGITTMLVDEVLLEPIE